MQRLVVVVVVVLAASSVKSLPRNPANEAQEKLNTTVAVAEPDPLSDSKAFIDAHGSAIASLPGSQVFLYDPLDTNNDGVVHPLEYLQSVFPFIKVVDKDEALATDDSTANLIHYLRKIIPIFGPNKVQGTNIENADEEEPVTFWEQLLIFLLRETNILHVDGTDTDGDGEPENDIKMSFTTVKFDPVGNLIEWLLNIIRDITQYESLEKWWTRVKQDYEKYTPFEAEVVEEKPEGEAHEGDPAVVVPVPFGFGFGFPLGSVNVAKFDPFVLGANTVLFVLYNALFCKCHRR